mgnify:FL=1
MKYRVINNSNLDMDKFRPLLKSFLPFVRQKMGFDRPVSIHFVSDPENSENMLGKTAHYDPGADSVSIYTDQRHPKDILRSLSHELVHHTQNCRGDLDQNPHMGEDYFQHDEYMKEMEREAYENGNMVFRDWEEKYKKQLQESTYYTGEKPMKRIDSRRNTLNSLLMEKFGYIAKKEEGITHLCAMLVTEAATGKVGHPINHTLLKDGTVTHYDVEFDDIIVEGMPVDALEVEVQKEHMHAEGEEDYEHDVTKTRMQYEGSEEELEEGAFAGDSKLDADEDGAPEWGDEDDNDPEVQQESKIREAIRQALRGT